jgi:hypothetical protein
MWPRAVSVCLTDGESGLREHLKLAEGFVFSYEVQKLWFSKPPRNLIIHDIPVCELYKKALKFYVKHIGHAEELEYKVRAYVFMQPSDVPGVGGMVFSSIPLKMLADRIIWSNPPCDWKC